jgi:hypothetical protein
MSLTKNHSITTSYLLVLFQDDTNIWHSCRHTATAIRGVVFGRAALAIDGVVFGLAATGIHNNDVCCVTSVIRVPVFCRTTLAICGIVVCCAVMALPGVVVCCTTTAIRGVVFSRAAMAIGGIVFSLTATGISGVVFCCATLVIGIVLVPPRHFGDTRHCHLPHHHGNALQTQQSAKRGKHDKDASNRGKATGNNQPVQQKDERVAQHECQCNNSTGDNDNVS